MNAGTVRDYVARAMVCHTRDLEWYFRFHSEQVQVNGCPATHLDQIVQQDDVITVEGRAITFSC